MENIDTSQALLSFFGLRRQPFAATADPMYFYATREHKECLFRLWNSIDERNGIAVVLGHYGTGKTTRSNPSGPTFGCWPRPRKPVCSIASRTPT